VPVRAGGEVARLLAVLQRDAPGVADAGVDRASASARLRVIGARAIDGLFRLLESDAPHPSRVAALHTLEGIDDPRIPERSLPHLTDPEVAVRLATVALLRAWLTRESGTRVLDALASLALDRQQDAAVRLAALDALSELPRDVIAPILEQAPTLPAEAPALETPDVVREWIAQHADAPLSTLHDLIVRAREHEQGERSSRLKQDWTVTRGAIHVAIARRNSRVALYDLREAFGRAEAPLPLDFLIAAEIIGDAECLEPMAHAWAAAPRDRWWRERVADTARDIVRRLGLSGRNAAIKRLRSRWPDFL
jgi:hypothetical protein